MRAATILLVLLAWGCEAAEAPPQPIPFNHARHLSVEVDGEPMVCTDCHPGAERGVHASLPSLQRCLECHMRPQGDPPSEAEREVRRLAAEGGPFEWIQVTRNPGHVYFSHRAHVTFAGMTCETCHGEVSEWTEPPRVPNADLLQMDLCMDCHRERGASNECAVCHK